MKYLLYTHRGTDHSAVIGRAERDINTLIDQSGWTPQGGLAISTSMHPYTLAITFYVAQALVILEPEDLQVDAIPITEYKYRMKRIALGLDSREEKRDAED